MFLENMKKNKDTFIFGEKVVLAPYRAHHVPKYHSWMQSEELQQLTASEPLTLEQEYEMQKSWLVDEDKCTFIILDAERFVQTPQTSRDEEECMVGDVNLFFNDKEDKNTAEVEIMIAEDSVRGKGLGKEALCAMMRYGLENLDVRKYTAKIGFTNLRSRRLFEKFKYREVDRVDVFEEITYEVHSSSEFIDLIKEHTKMYNVTLRDESKDS